MIRHKDITDEILHGKIRQKEITFGGNVPAKIYGLLSCTSGKRMQRGNRVFFTSAEEAIRLGYRPCGHCLIKEYQAWKFSLSLGKPSGEKG